MKTKIKFRSFLAIMAIFISMSVMFSCKESLFENSDFTSKSNQSQKSETLITSVARLEKGEDSLKINLNFYGPIVRLQNNSNNKPILDILEKSNNDASIIKVKIADGTIISAEFANANEIKKFKENLIPAEQASLMSLGDSIPKSDVNTKNARTSSYPVTMTLAKANQIFATFVNNRCTPQNFNISYCIPFAYASDGCYARAHWMKWIMESSYKLSCYKYFVVGNLRAASAQTKCCANWIYHVAPLVYIEGQYSYQAYILDPSLFNAPVPLNTWLSANQNIRCNKNVSITDRQLVDGSKYMPAISNGKILFYNTDDNLVQTNKTLRNYSFASAHPQNCKPI